MEPMAQSEAAFEKDSGIRGESPDEGHYLSDYLDIDRIVKPHRADEPIRKGLDNQSVPFQGAARAEVIAVTR
jgi:hypothetical protein